MGVVGVLYVRCLRSYGGEASAGGSCSARHGVEAGETIASGWLDWDLTPQVKEQPHVLEIVGTARGDRGWSCDDHTICGLEVVQEDVVVCLRREQILVPNKLGKEEKEETVYTVN